jgi:hypothetical protein
MIFNRFIMYFIGILLNIKIFNIFLELLDIKIN